MEQPLFEQYRTLRLKGLEYIRSFPDLLTSAQQSRLKLLTKATQQTHSFAELGAIVSLETPNANYGFDPIEGLEEIDPATRTCMRFGNATVSWYFMFGQAVTQRQEAACFTLMLFKLELAAPSVVAKTEFEPSQAVLWCLAGGVGLRSPEGEARWYAIPYNICPAEWKCGDSQTFALRFLVGPDSRYIKEFELVSREPGTFHFDLRFQPYRQKNQRPPPVQHLKGRLAGTEKPVWMGDGGCFPVCEKGVGSVWWTLPAMGAHFQVGRQKFPRGKGWFEHQYSSSQYVDQAPLSWIDRRLRTRTARWLFVSLQLEGGNQWIIAKFLPKAMVAGETVEDPEVLRFIDDKGIHEKGLRASLQVVDTRPTESHISRSTVDFPFKIRVGVAESPDQPYRYYLLRRDFGSGEAYLYTGIMSLDTCGSVWTENEGERLGNCFIECANWAPDNELVATTLVMAGYSDIHDLKAFMVGV